MANDDFTPRELYFIMERMEGLIGENKSKRAQLAAAFNMMKMAQSPDSPVEVVSNGPIPNVGEMHEGAMRSLDDRIAFLDNILRKFKAIEMRMNIDLQCGRISNPGGIE